MEEALNDEKNNLTKTGYLKAPKEEKFLDWIEESKREIKIETIYSAFDATAITSEQNSRYNAICEKLNMNFVELINRYYFGSFFCFFFIEEIG